MTPKQEALLNDLYTSGGSYLRGADVRVARALEKLGLITLEDNGKMKTPGSGRTDGERWMASLVTKTEAPTVANTTRVVGESRDIKSPQQLARARPGGPRRAGEAAKGRGR